jgi:small subunit ribosomal protein S8
MLTRVRNASMARHSSVTIPFSKMKGAIAEILKAEGFVRDFNVVRSGTHRALRIYLIYGEKGKPAITGLQRISKPSLRVYTGHSEVPRVYGGLGTTIVSTSKGVMSGKDAWKQKTGGEVLCVVW